MKRDGRRSRTHVDSDGVRVVKAETPWAVIVTVGVAALLVLVIMVRVAFRLDEPEAPPATHARARSTQRPEAGERRQIAQPARRVRAIRAERAVARAPAAAADSESEPLQTDAAAPPDDGPDYPGQPPTPPPSDYGWKGPAGIALFPPPGTNPPKSGIIVPDDFAVPPGYVRHYQTTDDGRELKPILMFHPDYQFVDENGNPLEIPADGVVPPDMAPPGLPIEILDVPDPVYPTGPPQEEIERVLKEHPEVLANPDLLHEHPEWLETGKE
jgi:hypothetical protein